MCWLGVPPHETAINAIARAVETARTNAFVGACKKLLINTRYQTAHSMCHKIRAALIEPETKLGGIVEVDETYVGGKDENRHADKRKHVWQCSWPS